MNKIKAFIKNIIKSNISLEYVYLDLKRFLREFYLKFFISDARLLKKLYQKNFKKELNLNDPQTFNEKIQYLKLQQRALIHSYMVDKFKARDYVAKKINNNILIPLLWVGNDPKKIPYDQLPNKFIIKANHNSGPVIIVKNKSTINKKKIVKELALQLKTNYYLYNREYVYTNIEKKIVVEELLGDNISDYKIFCFNGNPQFIQVDIDRHIKHKRYFYDLDWNPLDFNLAFSKNIVSFGKKVSKPHSLETMINYAKILSEGFPLLRIDFYEVDNKIYFGEITFYHGSGFEVFYPDHDKWDRILGEKISL